MLRIKKGKFIFIISNIFFFLTILFTYIDLRKFDLADSVYPNDFSFTTYLIIILFLLNLLLLFVQESKDKFKIFNIFIFYLILSSGVYVINFPLMDELILITSSFFFLIHLFENKKILFIRKNNYFLIILGLLFLQSIIGFLFDIRSIRYVFIFSSLILSFLYFSNLEEIDDNKQKIFLNYIYYAIVLYTTYQFLFWILKFNIFEMKFLEQRFVGDMQPAYAKSASGHFDAIHILSGYLILLFTLKSNSLLKKLLLFLFIFAFWIMADARSSLFILSLVIIFYFLILENKKKIILIFFVALFSFQNIFFWNESNKYIDSAKSIFGDVLNIKTGSELKAPAYQTKSGDFFYKEEVRASYGDFGRLSYILSAITALKYNFHKIFIGCGFYSYHYCTKEAQIEVYEKFDVPITDNLRGFGNKKIRPPAAGTIIVENGLLINFMILLYFLIFLKKNFYFKNGKLLFYSDTFLISSFLFIAIIGWALFSNMLDIILFYLFFLPTFRKYIFYKI